MENQLSKIIKKIIKDNYNFIIDDIKLEKPPKKELWDFAFWCFILSGLLKKNPNVIAEEFSKLINQEINNNNLKLIESVSVAWPYINIKISKNFYTDLFNETNNNKNILLKSDIWNWKTIIIDYIWANVWKPLHIWHMCTPNQWQTMINLYKKLWYKVISDSHIWDWWIIFWKLILAYKLWPDENKLIQNAVDYLLELYIKITAETKDDESLEQQIRDEFKLLSEGNSESVKLWEKFTKYSIEAMNIQLWRLNIKCDYNIWESFYEWLWLPKMEKYPDLKWDMKFIVKELIKKWIATKNEDNSVWVIFEDSEKIPSCILQKRDWTHWYLASDLASIKYRIDNWNPEKIIYFVDVRQQLHLIQAFNISKKAWWIENTELIHAYNWFISLKDWAMSTRTGRIIKLDKLLDEAEERAKKIILEKRNDIKWKELNELGKIIWIWAIKYGYLKKSRETDVIFDWDEFMSFEGNSWPYIQYAYVRARRILENYNKKIWNEDIWNFEFDEEIELVKILLEYNDVKNLTAERNMPHILCQYAYNLTKIFNTFYNSIHILNEEDESKKIIRLKLINLFIIILKDCFGILWIDMPEKM